VLIPYGPQFKFDWIGSKELRHYTKMFFVNAIFDYLIDETLPIKYKPKHPGKGEYKEQNGRTHVQEDKKTTKEGEPQGEHQVLEPLPVMRSISNKERGRPLEMMPSLEKPLPTTTTYFKIEIACARCSAIDTLYL
jgi:hypothetical protein